MGPELHEFRLYKQMGFPGGSEGKASVCNVGGPGLTPASGRSPGKGSGNPLQYSRLENPMDKRSLVGYSPWGRKESDMTERRLYEEYLTKLHSKHVTG